MDILNTVPAPTQAVRTDPENRWFTIYVHTCDVDLRGSGDRPTDGKQYIGQAMHTAEDVAHGHSNADVAERAMMRRWRQKIVKPSHLLAKAVGQFGAESFRHEVKFVVLGQTAANLAEERLRLELDTLVPRGYDKRKQSQHPISIEEMGDLCRAGWAAIGPERKSEIAANRDQAMGFARRSERSRKGKKTLGLEGCRAAKRKADETLGTEGRREARRKAGETLGTDGRRMAAIRGAETKGFEAMSNASCMAMETMGPDGLNKRARTRAERMGHDRLSAATHKAMETKGPEGMRIAARNSHISRWQRAFDLAVVSNDYEKIRQILKTSLAAVMRWAAKDLLVVE